MARFYCPLPLVTGQVLDLPPTAARHVQVLRMQPGHTLTLFNGEGGEFSAEVQHMGRSDVRVVVGEHRNVECEARCQVHLAVGMPANERMDWLVEKATELGVAHISPVMSQHTVLRLSGERGLKRQQHWQGIAQAACAQSGRNRVPQIDAPVALSEWLKTWPQATDGCTKVVLSLQEGARAWREVWGDQPPPKLVLLSGPEGGLSSEEEALARSLGFAAVQLGSRVLRSETAPLAVLAQLL